MSLESNASQIDVSIIVVSFNTRDITLDCLRSVYQQTIHTQFEIIVIDNASSDRSADCVEQFFPEIKLIRNSENVGFAAANNQGIKCSRGRNILLLNSDTIIRDDAIGRLVAYMDSHPKMGVVGPQLVDASGQVQLSARQFPTLASAFFEALHLHMLFPRSKLFGGQMLSWWDHQSERIVDSVEGSAFLIRRSVIDQVGLLDSGYFMYWEEVDWCWRVKQTGHQVVYFPGAKIIHFGSGSGYSRSPFLAVVACQSKLLFFWKSYGSYSVRVLRLILLIGSVIRLCGLWLRRFSAKDGLQDQALLEYRGHLAVINCLLHPYV